MHSFIQTFLQFKTKLKLEQFYNALVIVIIALILFLATWALFRPVTFEQQQQVMVLAQQATYPETQQMAQSLLVSSTIQRGSYLKLMQAHQFEQAQVKHYPAMSLEDIQ